MTSVSSISFPRNMPAVSQQQEALKDVLQASKAWAAQASVILQVIQCQQNMRDLHRLMRRTRPM